ncbi:hypothetical protein MVEN_01454300 [Mycena venus]|uniref:Uncharacterized protein n=1 Tax=Mycena venus TaxID=2733690 RepID=A0A8H6XTP5_9AGAR|nr:hypothetical protein MVEN_01454300 [Mycena venus]
MSRTLKIIAGAAAAFVLVSFSAQSVVASRSAPASNNERTDGLSPTWDIGKLEDVFIDIHNTGINYQLNGSRADEQWSALIPAGGGLVQLGQETFTISMYHQLKCLDIIRREYVAGSMGKPETSAAARHCLNYIRQMILCRGDRHLERVVDPEGAHAVQVRGRKTCKNWMRVYEKAHENEMQVKLGI